MWKDPEPDPGGNTQKGVASGQSSQELSNLKDQTEQQQLLISQLKEMLRKEQSNVTQEKVDEYINTLSKVKAKKTRIKRDETGSTERSTSSTSIDINKKEKLNLLRQQLEENKARLAERGKNQKGIEDMVTQLKAQLNDSQQLINLTPISLLELKNLEYSRNSTPEELYNILLTKERRITELVNKTQKQEATILDLQENLKEKDSVIDARTKAITLMTDSLSKKGKDTLDALDETKEQMRKMQENFVTLEGEMKARQVKLLNDLKAKNFEIAELQEEKSEYLKVIEKYKKAETPSEEKKCQQLEFNSIKDLQQQLALTRAENQENLLNISELEKKLQESSDELNKLRSVRISPNSEENIDEKMATLKKLLEESNRSMIKLKAQNKSKIKELNKQIDQFKKMSDANTLIVQLQTENTKLSEKIAELEEEKGNMQLKMVESTDSVKDSTLLEEYKELENKLARNVGELGEKDKIISLLESDILSLKEEMKNLNTKISGYSHLENVQVSSEIKSIQIEEQMEKVESENLKLRKEIEELVKEKENMAERIEELKKEKQEINSKLESYIQENMELIDKLEKLSAEKVSSAESIEIVEGLTQQEKLELAAYQKNLDVHIEGEPIKISEDDSMEPPPELNESVMQLSEDSTELLHKIEMFNMERKEVMGKMEALKEENSRLSLKIKEIENNRDILAETYEQLQNEKEALQNENDVLNRKLERLEEKSHREKPDFETDTNTDSDTVIKLQEIKNEYEKLLSENSELKRSLKECDNHIHEKHNLESELSRAKEKIEELETIIKTNLEELTFYQSLVEENKTELIGSANLINELQTKLNEREHDIKDLNVVINDLNHVVSNLQVENKKLGEFEIMENQIQELKSTLNDQIQQIMDYEEESARNNDIINDLNTRLVEMNKKIKETEHEMEVKDIESKELAQYLQDKDKTIRNLQSQVEEKDRKISIVVDDMKQKYLSLQKQLDGNSGSLQGKIEELTNKNKEQLEKMKKIAANLKKKTQAYQELEAKYSGEKEKWETEVNEKESIIADSKGKMASILQQLNELEEEVKIKTIKLLEAEERAKKLVSTIQSLEQSKVELQNTLIELRHKEEKLNEVNLKQELSTSLHEEFDNIPINAGSVNEEKIKELELIIETNESALSHYSERVHKLEQDIARLEEEKEAAERRVQTLSEQLDITLKNAEEKALVQEEVGQRLAQVTANDEFLLKKLDETTTENKEISEKNKELEDINYKLKVKLKKAHEKVTQLKSLQTNVEELETANGELKKQLAILEANQRHIQDENEELQRQNQSDYERIEADYQVQLEELVKCKNELTVECEKLQESLKEMQSREEELLTEIDDYKQKMEQKEANNKERIGELSDELRVANFNWQDSVKEIDTLNKMIEDLQKELVVFIAKETVESVISEALGKVTSFKTVDCQTGIHTNVIDSQVHIEVNAVSSQTVPDVSTVYSQTSSDVNIVGSQTEEVSTVATCCQTIDRTIKEPTFENTNRSDMEVPTFHWPGTEQSVQNQDWFATNVSVQQEVPKQTFNWFDDQISSNDPQDNVFDSSYVTESKTSQLNQSQPQPPVIVENTKEELLNKIRALEVLLYNMDKEKEDALRECTGMVNELTRLVYEKVNEIASKNESANPLINIESQIVSEADVMDAASKNKELHNIEFEKTDPSLGEQSHPVVEDVMQPKRAYLTYQPEHTVPSNVKLQAFGENDDGWGWGPEEAKLEEEHLYKAESTPQVQSLRREIAQLTEKLKVLQVERENHLEEIKQLQIKSGKLIKKCKELKLKNDQLIAKEQRKLESGDLFDLDETIQEEFKMQITQLEKRIKELTGEVEKEKHEKANILKRVDVLTAANDRMTEMKEIQDTEVLRWKRKHQEVEEKLQQYEWSSDGFNEGVKPNSISENTASTSGDNRTIKELQQIIKDLSADNDELQVLLEEQRQLRIDAEKAKTLPEVEYVELEGKMKLLEQELLSKFGEMEAVLQEKNAIVKEKDGLQKVLSEKESYIAELCDDLTALTGKNTAIEQLLLDKDKLIRDLQENEKSAILQQDLTSKISELENNISLLKNTIKQQEHMLDEKDAIYNELQSSFDQISILKEQLSVEVAQLTSDLEQQRQKCTKLQTESAEISLGLQKQLEEQEQKYSQLQTASIGKMNELLDKVEQQKEMYDQLQGETSKRIENLQSQLQQELQNKQESDTFELARQEYQLETLMAERDTTISDLNGQKIMLEQAVIELKHHIKQLQMENNELLKEVERQKLELNQMQNKQLEEDTFELAHQKHQLETLLVEKDVTISDLNGKKVELEQEIKKLKQHIVELQTENAKKVNELSVEVEQQKLKYDQLLSENARKISEAEQLQNKQHDSAERDAFELMQQKHELENLLAERDAVVSEFKGKESELEKEVEELKQHLEEKQKQCEQLTSERDAKIAKVVAELEENWLAQVDQRGADVAESWKLHLDAVEAEFTAVREKLKYEINELEEKCNALVNENNELRKNVDAEIRNEVDRISALQQQINDRQHYITELNHKLIEKQSENENLVSKLTVLENENEQLRSQVAERETKLVSLNIFAETTQKQFEEKREVVEEIVRILEKNTSWPLSYEKQDVLNEFQRQLNLISEKAEENLKLNQSIKDLQCHLNVIQEKDVEILRLKQSVEELQKQISLTEEKDEEITRMSKLVDDSQKQLVVLHGKDEEIYGLNKLVEDLQKELSLLKEKDEEITRLNQLVEDLQRQIGLLQEKDEEISRLNHVIENYKLQLDLNQEELSKLHSIQSNTSLVIEDYKQKLEESRIAHTTLQNSLEEKNQFIVTLNQRLQLTESLKNDNNKDVERLQEEVSQSKKDCAALQDSLSECQQQLFTVTSELTNKSQELENLNQQLAYSQQNFEILEMELNKLREFFQMKEQEYTSSLENLKKSQLRELENHYEEVVATKDLDIESFRSQLHESIQNSQQLTERINIEVSLRQQLEEKANQLEEKVTEQAALLDEENKQLGELRGIIEDQVIKIEELKKELFEKSRDYDSLIAEIDIGRKAITQQPTPTTVTGSVATSQSERLQQEEDLSEPVSRAELDLALYMLHQRDVRCEELTVELTQLLEERDTLQLRLSNAIREKEEIRRKLTGAEEVAATPSTSSAAPATPHSKSSAIFLAASGTELATEPLESSTNILNLESKLSELRRVGYKRDKTFVDEQELRRMQQMSIMQQHINEASKLPPEAAAKLVDASYTLSRDVQSPSKVLLNWLWGRSTPKVNDT